MEFKNIRFILMDVEGTTSDIRFVKEVMFPYSAKMLPQFLAENENTAEVQSLMQETSKDELLRWIEDDIKHPVLKKLQGMIWKQAFEKQEFQAPIYEDVLPAWKKWSDLGIGLGIYSSGSVAAQKLFFGHTKKGDLLSYLKAHYDLELGGKKESQSYQSIANSLALSPKEILFLSDVPEELLAAEAAEYQVAHIVRKGTATSNYDPVGSFAELEPIAPS